jgi:hypothetical protein
MADDPDRSGPLSILGAAEIELRRYEARLGVWKVILGTLIVGLAGVLIPGAISSYNAYFENQRKEIELRQAQQAAHQQYIKDFFATAINQDVELRIRFANYFANLSGNEQKGQWSTYHTSLVDQRKAIRDNINRLERRLISLESAPKSRRETELWNAEFFEVKRELQWAYAEIGYQPIGRSEITVRVDADPLAAKARLYAETVGVVAKLAAMADPIDSDPGTLVRFWELYRKDLIGVESREFATVMISIGKALQRLVTARAPADGELKRLAEELRTLADSEIAAESARVQTGLDASAR